MRMRDAELILKNELSVIQMVAYHK